MHQNRLSLRKKIETGTARMFLVNEPGQSKILLETAIAATRNPKLEEALRRMVAIVGTKSFSGIQQARASILYHRAMLGKKRK